MGSSHFVQVAPQYKTNYCPRTVASTRVFFCLFAVFAIQFYLDSFSCTSVACHHAQVFCFLPDLTSLSSNWCIVSCQDEVNIVFSPFCREVDRIMVLRLSTRRQCNQFARGKFHPILSPYNFLRATAPKCNTKLYVLCTHVQQTTKSTKKGKHHRSEKCWMNIGIAEGWSKNRITTWQYLAVVENLFWTGIAHK